MRMEERRWRAFDENLEAYEQALTSWTDDVPTCRSVIAYFQIRIRFSFKSASSYCHGIWGLLPRDEKFLILVSDFCKFKIPRACVNFLIFSPGELRLAQPGTVDFLSFSFDKTRAFLTCLIVRYGNTKTVRTAVLQSVSTLYRESGLGSCINELYRRDGTRLQLHPSEDRW